MFSSVIVTTDTHCAHGLWGEVISPLACSLITSTCPSLFNSLLPHSLSFFFYH